MRVRGRGLIEALAITALVVAACGGTAPSPVATAVSTPSSSPSATAAASVASTSAPASGSSVPSASASPALAYDDSLLQLLPTDIDGLPFAPDPEAFADLDAKTLGVAADRIAVAVISDAAAEELAVTAVLHLRDGAFGDAFFRAYRDSYDVAACEPAGGKAGNAEAQIGGRRTFIGTCGSGAHTYHVYLPAENAIVSIVSVGETRKFGERIVEGLRG